jgi:hypothetical protein
MVFSVVGTLTFGAAAAESCDRVYKAAGDVGDICVKSSASGHICLV